jgi:hypothetical protein
VSKWCLRVAGRRAYMTDHAIERYGQRVRPHLQRPDELYADALAEDRQRPGRLVALTVLTRGSISDEARRNRNRKRSHRTYAKRKRNKMEDRMFRGQRPEIAVEFDG